LNRSLGLPFEHVKTAIKLLFKFGELWLLLDSLVPLFKLGSFNEHWAFVERLNCLNFIEVHQVIDGNALCVPEVKV
jgi:hypothetical protein